MNHSSLTVGMTRESRESAAYEPSMAYYRIPISNTKCPECGAYLYPGDWPWCHGKRDGHAR